MANKVSDHPTKPTTTAFRIKCWVVGGDVTLVPANGIWPEGTSFTVEGVTGYAEGGTDKPLVIDTRKRALS